MKKALFFIVILVPFFSFSDYDISNTKYTILKYILRLITVVFLSFRFNEIFIKRKSVINSLTLYSFYIIWAIIVLIFSSDIVYSTIKLLEVCISYFLAVYLINRYTRSIEDTVFLIFNVISVYCLLFFVIGNTFYPSLYREMGAGGQLRLGGGLVNPNLLAYCFIILFISLKTFVDQNIQKAIIKKIAYWIGIAILIYLISLTYSRSAIIVLFVIVMRRLYLKYGLLLYVGMAGIGVFLLPFYIDEIVRQIILYSLRGEGIQNVSSFGGRIPIWKELILNYNFGLNTLTGFGFQCLSDKGLAIDVESWGGHELTMAHNNFLQVFYGLGVIGLLLAVSVFVTLYRELRRIFNRVSGLFWSDIYLVFAVFSLVEFGVYGSPNILVLVFSVVLHALHKYRSVELVVS